MPMYQKFAEDGSPVRERRFKSRRRTLLPSYQQEAIAQFVEGKDRGSRNGNDSWDDHPFGYVN